MSTGISVRRSSVSATERPDDEAAICRAGGACSSFSSEWPRFSVEDDADLDRIPPAFVDDARGACGAMAIAVRLSWAMSAYRRRARFTSHDPRFAGRACRERTPAAWPGGTLIRRRRPDDIRSDVRMSVRQSEP